MTTDDFVAFQANWDSKDRNLVQIASDINVLPEAFVFVDDNPVEREIVRQSIEGTAIPELSEVERYLTINEMYQANAKRNQVQAQFADYGDYLISLEMKGTIKPFEANYISRIAQLTNKSNQYNLTTKCYTQGEIELIAASMRRGIKEIYGYYYPTEKNVMVKEFYALQGFSKVSEKENGDTIWKLSVDDSYETKNKVIKVN